MIDRFGEILARPNVFNIHEHTIRAEYGDEVIAQSTGIRGGVLAAIADEYVARG